MPGHDLTPPQAPLLDVKGLNIQIERKGGNRRIVTDVSFTVARGETLCIVGESGSGKTLTALSLMSLLPPRVSVTGGGILFNGRDLLTLDSHSRERLNGDEIAMIFQDPMSSLNPVMTVGRQLTESLSRHQPSLTRAQRESRAEQALALAGISRGADIMHRHPHQLSGGMCQRVLIAIALVNHPRLIIADEPTTALDVTVQAQVMKSMRAACEQTGAALLLITHDMQLVAQYAHRVAVMYAGRIVEQGQVHNVFRSPRHPYTRALLGSIPGLDTDVEGDLEAIAGEPPDFARLPSGCAFRPRCGLCANRTRCATEVPLLRAGQQTPDHLSACHFADELSQPANAGIASACQ
ncbi:ABC transporter ATP-binding protein [Sodalis sp. dw_96]|uniref:ABC transporter ATP-binding protein n=1 Tax=Sodalis sp. dw_96 TaxID=2719794 RepID=UPI001BD475D2|nr:ABC transporter ATP-binding protein [Sodalis sp. dw_96]